MWSRKETINHKAWLAIRKKFIVFSEIDIVMIFEKKYFLNIKNIIKKNIWEVLSQQMKSKKILFSLNLIITINKSYTRFRLYKIGEKGGGIYHETDWLRNFDFNKNKMNNKPLLIKNYSDTGTKFCPPACLTKLKKKLCLHLQYHKLTYFQLFFHAKSISSVRIFTASEEL